MKQLVVFIFILASLASYSQDPVVSWSPTGCGEIEVTITGDGTFYFKNEIMTGNPGGEVHLLGPAGTYIIQESFGYTCFWNEDEGPGYENQILSIGYWDDNAPPDPWAFDWTITYFDEIVIDDQFNVSWCTPDFSIEQDGCSEVSFEYKIGRAHV